MQGNPARNSLNPSRHSAGMTDRAQTIANIQVLRAIAALLVVFCHAVDTEVHARGIPVLWTGWIDDFGAIGVDLFFVISGFIIAHTAFGEHQYRATDFLRRRIYRIVPLYFLLSLPWILRGLTLGPLEPDRVIATLLFWPASDATAASLPYLTVGWTLCFEMLFYLMAARVLAGPRHLPGLLILLHALCWLCAIATGLSAFFFLGNPIIYEFLFGVGIALAASRLAAAAHWLGPLALLAGTAGFVATLLADFSAVADVSVVQADPMVIQRVAMGGLPSAALVLGAVLMPPWRPNALFASLAYLGAASYSLYLIHLLPLLGLETGWRWSGIAAMPGMVVCIGMTLSLASGLAVYRYLERPLLGGTLSRRPAAVTATR